MEAVTNMQSFRTNVPEPLYRRFRAATALDGMTMAEVILAKIEAHVRGRRIVEEPVGIEEHVKP